MPRIKVGSSAGMLFPEVQVVRVAGVRLRVLELRVRDVAAIERDFARIAGHPHAGIEDTIAALKEPGKLTRDERVEHRLILLNHASDWPPRFGGWAFNEILEGEDGQEAYLWRLLRRTNRSLARGKVRDLMAAMGDDERITLGRIAWGVPPWKSRSPEGEPDELDGEPIDWGREIADSPFTPEQIGRMFLSQFLNIRSGGAKRVIPIDEWTG